MLTSAQNALVLAALRELLAAWQDQFGVDACDCMFERYNEGHVCAVCKAKLAIEALEGN